MTRFVLAAVFGALFTISSGIWPTAFSDAQVPTDHADTTQQAKALEEALSKSGDNRAQLVAALAACTPRERRGMEFLIANMPRKDRHTLTSEFLLAHVRQAYKTWDSVPWRDSVPEEVFLNGVLPYANVNERRDEWRTDFNTRFSGHVSNAKSPGEAGVILNHKIFGEVGVKYSTKRPKADQSPYESIEAGLASCTGLSILLIDACRAVGVPARLVGTPRWSDNSGNHSWVEIWDNGGWHFTGAAEQSGDDLDRGWFAGRAKTAQRDHRLHAIYAVSFRKTPLNFPLVWNSEFDDLTGVNVTDRYTQQGETVPDGKIRVRFRLLRADGHARRAGNVAVLDEGSEVFAGVTKDERFDANDHVTAILSPGTYTVRVDADGHVVSETVVAERDEQLVTLSLPTPKSDKPAADATSLRLAELRSYLKVPRDQRPALTDQPFATKPLTRQEADTAAALLWADLATHIRESRAAEMKDRVLRHRDQAMPFHYEVFGEAPAGGRSLFISMHGGGGAPKRVNDQQWENQKKLYKPAEGVYLAPRAPTDTWNLWHQAHIDPLFDRLITNLVSFENVDPNRVYLMGYSAGGDGVYQLAPRMADRLAAAAMMAGHPNETSPLGLRNLPFTLHMGGDDKAYRRNEVAREWKKKLSDLRDGDPEGYLNWVEIHEGKGHWMDRQDAAAVPWMAKHTRQVAPAKVVWVQDDVTHPRFYWLSVAKPKARSQITAEVKKGDAGPRIELDLQHTATIAVRLTDDLLDLDQPFSITTGGRSLFSGKVTRTIATLYKTLLEREDPQAMYSAEVELIVEVLDAK